MKNTCVFITVCGIFLLGLSGCSKDQGQLQYTTVTDYDGNIYRVVKIGTQAWVTGNLLVTHYSDGTPIPYACTGGSGFIYYSYNCDTVYAYDLGYYYPWKTVLRGTTGSSASPSGIQGPCPTGFHVPSDAEWQTLINYLGGSAVAGGPMKGQAYWESGQVGYAAQNASGFNALPGGYVTIAPSYTDRDGYALFWSTTAHDSVNSNTIIISGASAAAIDTFLPSGSAMSCRCLQN